MIDSHTFNRVKSLSEQDRLKPPQIARALGLSAPTVGKWLARDRFESPRRGPRRSILDPYKDFIQQLTQRHPYTAAQIPQFVRERGYEGGRTAVTDYVREHCRPPRRGNELTGLWFLDILQGKVGPDEVGSRVGVRQRPWVHPPQNRQSKPAGYARHTEVRMRRCVCTQTGHGRLLQRRKHAFADASSDAVLCSGAVSAPLLLTTEARRRPHCDAVHDLSTVVLLPPSACGPWNHSLP